MYISQAIKYKTRSALYSIVVGWYKKPGSTIWFIPSVKHFHRVIIPEIHLMKDYISDLVLNVSERKLTCKGLEGVIVFELPNTERLLGLRCDNFIIEEEQSFDKTKLMLIRCKKHEY